MWVSVKPEDEVSLVRDRTLAQQYRRETSRPAANPLRDARNCDQGSSAEASCRAAVERLHIILRCLDSDA